jgi:hypothetical protein
MAKKTSKTKVEVIENKDIFNTTVEEPKDIVISQTAPKEKISELSIFDLINYEKAISLICRRYENSVKLYDGTIRQNSIEYENFKKTNDLHNRIMLEIEKRVNGLM